MQFSAMTMNMFFPSTDDPGDDNRIIDMAVAQSIWLAELGYHVWFTDHHFRGPWHSNPMQFASYIAPLIPRDRYIGFGVLSIPFYHPVRLVESMNLLDQLTKGKVLFGVGSGWQGTEPNGLGVDPEAHASGRLAEETLDVMERLWGFKYGDPEYSFSVGSNSGRIKRRIMPAPYSKPYPTIIRVATREAGIVRAAQKGWPVFVGVLGADLREQMQIYRRALDEANHPQDVKDNCLRWCSYDWVGVTVADNGRGGAGTREARTSRNDGDPRQLRPAARQDGRAGDQVDTRSIDGRRLCQGRRHEGDHRRHARHGRRQGEATGGHGHQSPASALSRRMGRRDPAHLQDLGRVVREGGDAALRRSAALAPARYGGRALAGC